ncbi:hypothetical protein BUALT_Bualt02G0031300 [Buddleja alternifolia]|uniref:Phytosulfokine n=1 Tax=Buddleja alternifolia TaxID=168488 RepID=A0AAV6XX56_9LAMI|nr:hypothetical protein BUALT_Bualt02G0031300 [Buddleja alternifolia]
MKLNFLHLVALLFFLGFLITTSHSSGRKLAAKEGEADAKLSTMEPAVKMESVDSFDKVMGVEECENEEDEECLKRRVILEAHLDYIYTQHHKP